MSCYTITLVEPDPQIAAVLGQAVRRYDLHFCEVRATPDETKGPVLDLGASERFTRPYRLGALLDHLRWQYHMADGQTVYPLGPYDFHPLDQSLGARETGRVIHLTHRERDILWALMKSDDGYTEKTELLRAVWGYRDDLETHTLETHIYRLRQKIEADPADPALLLTREHGYQLKL